MFDTIAAISTGNINQAISIIRISGPESFSIIKKISSLKKIKAREISLCSIYENKLLVDKVIITPFKAPNSYTGEDIIEINAHGGVVVTQRILKLCIKFGARIAEPGEFSKRAFLNGKINLIEAEGINNLIHAQSISQTKIAANNLEGRASKTIIDLKNKLTSLIGIIEVNIDYPEYEDTIMLTNKTLMPKLINLKNEIQVIVDASILTNKLYEGIKIGIIGETNSGKSTLLNNIVGKSKAIVSPIAGTTRDVVEGNIEINGILYHFFDTAGLRTSDDGIENLGMKKTLEVIENSDFIIYLVDPTHVMKKDISKLFKNKEYIKVFSKSDLKKMEGISINHKNIEMVLESLNQKFKKLNLQNDGALISIRQQALLDKSLDYINQSINGLKNGYTPDIVIVDIKESWECISNILGQAHNENLLDEIFKRFCLGK